MTQNSTLSEDPLLNYFNASVRTGFKHRNPEKKEIPPTLGSGHVTSIAIEEGICAAYYDVVFLSDLQYSFPQNLEKETGDLFRLVFSLAATDQEEGSQLAYSPAVNRTSFYSINFERKVLLTGQKRYRSVQFIFSKKWLAGNYRDGSEKILKLVRLLSKKKTPTLFQEVLDIGTYKIAHEIATDVQFQAVSLLCLKAKVFTLLNNFFQRTVQRSQRNLKKNQALYYAQIREIEKTLAKYYTEELPNIAILAREFNISSSTLKRQFKLIFNKSIYHYYLEQKMALGFSMLEEKNASVSEIAYRLGYNKINSFSKIFKKHYGILPSQF